MAIQLGGSSEDDTLNSTINTTPLVDVMLVLLIIFLITIPVVTTSIKVNLPREANSVRLPKAEDVIVSINGNGRIYLYDRPVANKEQLQAELDKLRQQAVKDKKEPPEVHIRGDALSNYEPVGQVIEAVQGSGLSKVAFITDPVR